MAAGHGDLARGAAVDSPIPAGISNAGLRDHPLAIWVETRLGLERRNGEKWVRARPITLAETAAQLAHDAGQPEDACAAALKEILTRRLYS